MTSNGDDRPSGFTRSKLSIKYYISPVNDLSFTIDNITDNKNYHPLNGIDADPLPGRKLLLTYTNYQF